MKRSAILLGVISLMMITLCACGNGRHGEEKATENNYISSDPTSHSDPLQPTVQVDQEQHSTDIDADNTNTKISGVITGGSYFWEGLAFVNLEGNSQNTYCIDESGNIVFELNQKLADGLILEAFQNGLVLLNDGGICDSRGNITYPEDVGVNRFFGQALKGGYIIAEKITADYNTTTKEIGVMDSNFEWIAKPSAKYYDVVYEYLTPSYPNSQKRSFYYYNDTLCSYDCKYYFDLKTGKMLEELSGKYIANMPSSMWRNYSLEWGPIECESVYRDAGGKVVLDLSKYQYFCTSTRFIEGKAAVGFYNESVPCSFFTVIDEEGNFAFEPVMCGGTKMFDITTNGKDTVVVTFGEDQDAIELIRCYDMSGNLLGELVTSSLGEGRYDCILGDGSITVATYDKCYYFKSDFTPLFN